MLQNGPSYSWHGLSWLPCCSSSFSWAACFRMTLSWTMIHPDIGTTGRLTPPSLLLRCHPPVSRTGACPSIFFGIIKKLRHNRYIHMSWFLSVCHYHFFWKTFVDPDAWTLLISALKRAKDTVLLSKEIQGGTLSLFLSTLRPKVYGWPTDGLSLPQTGPPSSAIESHRRTPRRLVECLSRILSRNFDVFQLPSPQAAQAS